MRKKKKVWLALSLPYLSFFARLRPEPATLPLSVQLTWGSTIATNPAPPKNVDLVGRNDYVELPRRVSLKIGHFSKYG
jgi:hypothetical protein